MTTHVDETSSGAPGNDMVAVTEAQVPVTLSYESCCNPDRFRPGMGYYILTIWGGVGSTVAVLFWVVFATNGIKHGDEVVAAGSSGVLSIVQGFVVGVPAWAYLEKFEGKLSQNHRLGLLWLSILPVVLTVLLSITLFLGGFFIRLAHNSGW